MMHYSKIFFATFLLLIFHSFILPQNVSIKNDTKNMLIITLTYQDSACEKNDSNKEFKIQSQETRTINTSCCISEIKAVAPEGTLEGKSCTHKIFKHGADTSNKDVNLKFIDNGMGSISSVVKMNYDR